VADDVTLPGVPAREREPEPVAAKRVAPDRRERARLTSYRLRFGIVYVILAAVVGAAVGSFVVLVGRPAPPEAAKWSSWQPEGSPLARARQIADRIPKTYLLPSGNQLDIAVASGLRVQTGETEIKVRSVVVRPDTSRGQAEEGDIAVHDANDAISFGLCGLGKECAIAEGEASADRFTLLRRQALELSLYTFKYVDEVDSVVVFMPPTPKGQSNGAVFLRREDLADELRSPLRHTLPSPQAPAIGAMSEAEQSSVVRLTQSAIYAFEFQLSPDGSPLLILSPPGVTG
jgi:hypothetical protein